MGLITTITSCLSAALLLGYITQRLKLSPIIGYLIAGIIVSPYSPGFVADIETASQLAEIGVILLMFGVGLHFHLKDLIAVKNVAIPGALAQIIMATLAGAIILPLFGYSTDAGIIFGISVSVASTVVLMRVLMDNRALHNPIGHTALGWLVVEDLFTILVLVLFPVIVSGNQNESLFFVLSITILKLILLVILTLFLGQKILPSLLGYVAKTGAKDLFTLAILVLALGIAVGASEFFGASMALGAFLAGMVIGQSDYSARAASEALPMKDAFAVLFFVSVGMLFNPSTVFTNYKLVLATLFIVMIIKPLVAMIVVLLLKQPLKKALVVGIALAQIGEFSFILINLGMHFELLDQNISNAVISTAIISITLNPLIYKGVDSILKFIRKFYVSKNEIPEIPKVDLSEEGSCVIIIGYGPIGRKIASILLNSGSSVTVIEMNIETVKEIHSKKINGLYAIYGDASHREILSHAGIECAQALVISSAMAPSADIIEIAKSLNPKIRILIHTTYLKDIEYLKSNGADVVFSGEGEVAKSLCSFILNDIGRLAGDVNWQCDKFDD